MTAIAFSSPRLRRRLVWAGVVAGVIAAIAAAVALMPSHGTAYSDASHSSAPAAADKAQAHKAVAATHRAPAVPAQPAVEYRNPPTVPVPRAAINALLDRFIPAVIARKNLAAGWNLVTADARGSRAEWLRGTMPFQSFPARDRIFRGWIVNYSYPNDVGFDIFLAPPDPAHHVSMAFRGEAKRIGGVWKIAVFYPQATFQPTARRAAIWADTDMQPQAVSGGATSGRLGAAWLLLPISLLGAALVGTIVFAVVRAVRRRARVREFERSLAAVR